MGNLTLGLSIAILLGTTKTEGRRRTPLSPHETPDFVRFAHPKCSLYGDFMDISIREGNVPSEVCAIHRGIGGGPSWTRRIE